MARRKWTIETIEQVQSGEQPFIQVGYTGPSKRKKVGDEWVDGKGKRWKKTENGIVSVNQQSDSIRDLVRQICPDCGMNVSMLGNKLDKKMFLKTGKCYDCVEFEEMGLRTSGKFKAYEEKKILQNKLSYLHDFRNQLIESIDYLKKDDSVLSLVTSQGDVVKWTGSQNAELLKIAETDLVDVNKLIADVEKMVSELK